MAKASCTAEHLFLSLVPHTPAGFGVQCLKLLLCPASESRKKFFHNGFTLSGTGPSMLRNQRSSSSSDLHSGGLKAACSFPKSLLGWGQCSGNKRADSEAKNGAQRSPAEQPGQGSQFSFPNKSKHSDLELYLSSEGGMKTGRDPHLPQQQ